MFSSYLDLQVGEDEYGPGGCGDGPPDGGRQTREIQDDEDHSAGRRGGQALNERKHCICRPHQSEQRASTLSSDLDSLLLPSLHLLTTSSPFLLVFLTSSFSQSSISLFTVPSMYIVFSSSSCSQSSYYLFTLPST